MLPQDFAAAHQQVLADSDIQFRLPGMFKPPPVAPPTQTPQSEPFALGEFFAAIFQFFAQIAYVLFWALVVLIVGMILYHIVREFTDFSLPWQRKKSAGRGAEEDEEWVPEMAPARTLLAEADALAAQGRFGEAAHLLLLRSVEDIDKRKPDLLKPSSTSREISVAQRLPEKARDTFGLIARHVEASLFGGRNLDAGGWDQCREAYGRFALAGEWR
jgi:hypothetical protein